MWLGKKVRKISNRVKDEQLGCSYSSARMRLAKTLIFSFLQRLGEDVCFRCGKKIENIEDLSVDHKEPWLHNDIALFWDINNISFSHRKCNSGARRSTKKKWNNLKERNREAFAKTYADPVKRERWLKQRRERYKMARSSTVG